MAQWAGLPEDAVADDAQDTPLWAGLPDDAEVGFTEPAPPEKPEPFKDTSLNRDYVAAFGGGLYGAGLGVLQLGAEAVNFVLPGEPLKEQVTSLRDLEEERRGVMGQLKEKYGAPGVTNPMSRAGFLGETAPYLVAGGVSAARGAASTYPVSLGRTAAEGAVVGAAGGASAPLTEDENRGVSTAIGGVAGAVLAPAARLGIEATGDLYRFGKNKVADAIERHTLRKVAPEVGKLLDNPAENALETSIRSVAKRPAGDIKSTAAAARKIADDHEVVKTMAKLRDEVPISRGGVEVRGKLPQTINEASEMATNTAEKLGAWIDDIAATGQNQGLRIPVNDAIAELRKVSVQGGFSSQQVAQAERLATELTEISGSGGYTFSAALRRMRGLNNDIKQLFTGKNTSGDSPELLGLVANKIRQALNQTAEQVQGGGDFAKYRKLLGATLDFDRRLLKTVEKQAQVGASTKLSAFDIIGVEQILHGHPLPALGSFTTQKVLKYLNSPDRAIKRMFKAADHLVGKERMMPPAVVAGPPAAPPVYPTTPGKTRIAAPGAPPRTIFGEDTLAQPVPTYPITPGKTRVKAPGSEPVDQALDRMTKKRAIEGKYHNAVALEIDGEYVAVVDGFVVGRGKTADVADYIDSDFWRGEIAAAPDDFVRLSSLVRE